MKFLLAAINAKYIHTNLAIRLLAAYTEQHTGICPTLCEFTINQQPEEILRALYQQQPDVIGFSCYIWNISIIKDLVCQLKLVLPNTRIFLGGPEISYDDGLLRQIPCELLVRGEGEHTVANLLQAWEQGQAVDQIPGISWWDGHTMHHNPSPAPLELDDIPFAYQHCQGLEHKIIYYETSRGCPYRCGYCLSSMEHGVRFLSQERVEQDLAFFLKQKVKQVKFVDRSFHCDPARALSIWKFIAAHDNGATNFHCELNAETLQLESLDFLQTVRPGLFQFEIGVQSTNPQTMAAVRRTGDWGRLCQVVRTLQKGGNIHLHLDLIAGLPYEDFDSFGRSFDQVYALDPHQLQLGFLKLLQGCELHTRQQEFSLVCSQQPPYEVLCTRWLPFDRLLRLKTIAYLVEHYHNARRYQHSLNALMGYFDSAFACFDQFAAFWENRQLAERSLSNQDTYAVLFAFAQEAGCDPDELAWRMNYDFTLHQNPKRLPAFLKQKESVLSLEQIRIFFENEQNLARYLPAYHGIPGKQVSRMAHLGWYPFDANMNPKGSYLLFDYKHKDLFGNATVTELDPRLLQTP